jgi:hypothetical protein
LKVYGVQSKFFNVNALSVPYSGGLFFIQCEPDQRILLWSIAWPYTISLAAKSPLSLVIDLMNRKIIVINSVDVKLFKENQNEKIA